jgi:hypothetical protein
MLREADLQDVHFFVLRFCSGVWDVLLSHADLLD